jgi:hypothetical protein
MYELTIFGLLAILSSAQATSWAGSNLSQRAFIRAARQADREQLNVQGFTVEVSFSEKARQKLTESKETIVAISYFTANPRKDASLKAYRKLLSRPGPLGLGEVEVEATPGESLKFGAIKLDQSAIAVIDDQGPQLLLNVVSGRRSSENNLLDCGIFEGALKSVQGTVIPIACKLIEERHRINVVPGRLIKPRRAVGKQFFGYWLTAVMAVDKPPVATPVAPALVRVPSSLTVKMEAALSSLVT